jgi:hypothetical protein
VGGYGTDCKRNWNQGYGKSPSILFYSNMKYLQTFNFSCIKTASLGKIKKGVVNTDHTHPSDHTQPPDHPDHDTSKTVRFVSTSSDIEREIVTVRTSFANNRVTPFARYKRSPKLLMFRALRHVLKHLEFMSALPSSKSCTKSQRKPASSRLQLVNPIPTIAQPSTPTSSEGGLIKYRLCAVGVNVKDDLKVELRNIERTFLLKTLLSSSRKGLRNQQIVEALDDVLVSMPWFSCFTKVKKQIYQL